ncbi:ABC transporter permease [Mesorhizobium sp.]|uniref:ABC transporter permease subunit n=1 Tax=Mesorhizobium sp. TaxID=1871066 RepID=UPI0025C06B04|nr:ABC transporter permease [Mesorhizobium sp.]
MGITTSADANIGNGYTLLAIAGVILGGGEFVGGRVSPIGAVIGALTLALAASPLLTFMHIPPDWQVAANGAILITLGPGNVDLSLPANIGLASAVAMKVMDGNDSMIAVGLLAALACGAAIGAANYLLIWALRIPPIIATLSASFIIQSIDISYGRGLQIKPPPGFADFANWQILGIPVLAILTVLFTIGAAVALQRMIYGRSVLAIGQNIRAAWLAGVSVGRIRFLTYTLSGALGGMDGALLAGYFRGANVDIGNEYLLASIAVVVIGGTSVAGGKANVPGVWGAALFLVLLLTMLNTFGVSAGVRLLLTGLIIVGVITAAGGQKAPR